MYELEVIMHIEGIDEVDNRILDVIKDNARLTYKEIGERTGISRVSVKTRMEALEKRGVIKGYRTVIDPAGMPEGTRFLLDIECNPEYFDEVVRNLSESRMIRQIYAMTGDCRIHAAGYASSSRNLSRFANDMFRNERGVRRMSCHTVLSVLHDMDGGTYYVRDKEDEHLETGRE